MKGRPDGGDAALSPEGGCRAVHQSQPGRRRARPPRQPRGFAVSLADAGARTAGVIRCDQPHALDLAARHGRRLETVPEPIMDEVLARLAAILA